MGVVGFSQPHFAVVAFVEESPGRGAPVMPALVVLKAEDPPVSYQRTKKRGPRIEAPWSAMWTNQRHDVRISRSKGVVSVLGVEFALRRDAHTLLVLSDEHAPRQAVTQGVTQFTPPPLTAESSWSQLAGHVLARLSGDGPYQSASERWLASVIAQPVVRDFLGPAAQDHR